MISWAMASVVGARMYQELPRKFTLFQASKFHVI